MNVVDGTIDFDDGGRRRSNSDTAAFREANPTAITHRLRYFHPAIDIRLSGIYLLWPVHFWWSSSSTLWASLPVHYDYETLHPSGGLRGSSSRTIVNAIDDHFVRGGEEEEESGSGGFGYLLTPNGVSAPGCGIEVKQVCLAKNSRLLESVEIILTTRHVGGEEEAIDGIYCLARRDLISGME